MVGLAADSPVPDDPARFNAQRVHALRISMSSSSTVSSCHQRATQPENLPNHKETLADLPTKSKPTVSQTHKTPREEHYIDSSQLCKALPGQKNEKIV